MPHINVYIHFVWATKRRIPFLDSKNLRSEVWNHIRENADKKGIDVDIVKGYEDHCHCLVSLRSDQTIENIMRLTKGESSYWINKNKLTVDRFAWQNDYYAVSVSQSNLESVRRYISRQEEHHQRKSFIEEERELIERFGFQKFSD